MQKFKFIFRSVSASAVVHRVKGMQFILRIIRRGSAGFEASPCHQVLYMSLIISASHWHNYISISRSNRTFTNVLILCRPYLPSTVSVDESPKSFKICECLKKRQQNVLEQVLRFSHYSLQSDRHTLYSRLHIIMLC